ncbi:hypothetical protein M8J75_007775 [Diaphorina citri]|nr:hypothetical protein M8J75_007775 [Diaphorina citri]
MRQSMHHKLSRRGEELLSNTDNMGLTVLNGRTVGDIPAQYTFIDTRKSSSTGEHFESSILDLVFCSISMITDVPSEVKNILRKLKNNKASGPDHIPNEVYKSLSNIDYIVGLFNLVFDEELIPPEWSQSKLIRLLRSFYEKATCRIRVDAGDELTDEIQVKRGTIQGDSASPLLFLLFTCDLVQYLRDRGFTGIQLSAAVDVMILLYADDMVILGYSKSDLQRKINALREYCCDNDLKINTQKTKVVVFRKSGRLSKDDKFTYEGEELEVVRDFVYLGVKFSSSGLFRNHMIYAMSKSKIALANIKNIMVSSKMDSWESRLKLYSSIVKVTLLYSGEIWALRYYEEIERTQVQFFKTILLTKYNTPNHYIRMETGTLPLSYSVLQSSLRWLIKVQKMSDSRIPKLCLQKLLIMDNSSSNDIRYNWISQVKNMLQTVGLQANDQVENLHDRLDNILETAEEKLFQDDKRRILDSNYNNHYKHIKQLVTRKEGKHNKC